MIKCFLESEDFDDLVKILIENAESISINSNQLKEQQEE